MINEAADLMKISDANSSIEARYLACAWRVATTLARVDYFASGIDRTGIRTTENTSDRNIMLLWGPSPTLHPITSKCEITGSNVAPCW